MRSRFVFLLFLISGHVLHAQIFVATSSTVSFFSEAPLENIEATNTTARPILNTANNEVAMRVPIKGFTFEKDLMQEHFNENYMESDKYPNATFKGRIIDTVDFTTEGIHKVAIKGMLDIHGISKERTLEATLKVGRNEITVSSEFWISTKDHGIEIPKVVFQNISEKILVKMKLTLVPYKK